MNHIYYFFKECKDFLKFFWGAAKKESGVVIYVDDAHYFEFLEGIIKELTETHNLPIRYVTSDPRDPLLHRDQKNIRSFYIRLLLEPFVLLLKTKIFLVTIPDDIALFHLKKSGNIENYIYTFHTIGSIFHIVKPGGILHYDTIFCVGPHHVRELRREEELYGRAPRNLIEVGYYRLEKIHCQYLQKRKNGIQKSIYKAKILVAPGWGPWHERNTLLDMCGRDLLRALLEANYEVVLRPHHMTRKLYPALLDGLYQEFQSYKNFVSEENLASTDSFYTADILISDWSGVVYEFAFGTEKPVLFIDVPIKINNTQYKDYQIEPMDIAIRERIGEVLHPHEVNRADEVISVMIKKKAHYREHILEARKEYIYNFGSSSTIAAQYIHDFLVG
jgi:YidC/Oxa1 family membrane protein insertase